MEKHYHCYVAGLSADHREIYHMILGCEHAKKHLIVLANLHAREYMTTKLCIEQIKYYKENHDKTLNGVIISDILDRMAIHYFPSCNPDGTIISKYGFQKIRDEKLREILLATGEDSRRWKANARAVDLNRNWDSNYWHLAGNEKKGLSGKKPESEPEIKVILKAIEEIEQRGEILGIISYHSTGSVIFGLCTEEADEEVKTVTTKMYQKAQELTGYELMPEEKMEDTLGCSREYFLYTRKIPFITIEIGIEECPLKEEEFSDIWERNKNLVLEEALLFLK